MCNSNHPKFSASASHVFRSAICPIIVLTGQPFSTIGASPHVLVPSTVLFAEQIPTTTGSGGSRWCRGVQLNTMESHSCCTTPNYSKIFSPNRASQQHPSFKSFDSMLEFHWSVWLRSMYLLLIEAQPISGDEVVCGSIIFLSCMPWRIHICDYAIQSFRR